MLRDSLKGFKEKKKRAKVLAVTLMSSFVILAFAGVATAEELPLIASDNALTQSNDDGFILDADELLIEDDFELEELASETDNEVSYATHLLNPMRTAVLDEGAFTLSIDEVWSKGLRPFIYRLKRRYDGVLSRPVIYKDTLFTGSAKKRLYAFDMKDGKARWSFKAKSNIVASPSVTDEMVCFGTKGGVFHCLKTETGEELWSVKVKGEVLSSPIFTDTAVYFTSTNNRIHGFDRMSGEPLWVYTHDSLSYVYPRIISSPAYSNGRLFVLFGDGTVVSIEAKSGRLNWKERVLKAPVASTASRKTPLLDVEGERLYVIDDAGRVLALNALSGEVEERYAGDSVTDFTVYEGVLYTLNADKVEAIDKATGTILWRSQLREGGVGRAIAIAGEYLVVTSNGDHKPWGISNFNKRVGYLDILSRSNGEELWQRRLSSKVLSEPYIYDNSLAVVTVKGRLSVFQPSRK